MGATDLLLSLARSASAVCVLVGFGIGIAHAESGSLSDHDAEFIRQQIIPCWNFDAGVTHPENYRVEVSIDISPDGRITGAKVLDQTRLSDPTYHSVAEGALHAVQNPSCQPLRFPPGKYWPRLTLIFDLAKAINGEE